MRLNLVKNNEIESTHQIKFIVLQAGAILDSNITEADYFFPRSALKPLQALTLIKSGALDAFGLNEKHIALSCASHAGQKEHTTLAGEWLRHLSIDPQQLACGAHRPYDPETDDEMIRQHKLPTKLHNNCSGKHSGFLTVCRHLKIDIQGYEQPQHPFQKLLRTELEEYCGESLGVFAIDGCSIPAPRMSLMGYAKACDHFLMQSYKENTAESRILPAFMKHSLLTSGKIEFYHLMMAHNPYQVFLKVGAEGVLLCYLPQKKITIVLKVLDGAERALPPTASYLLSKWADIPINKTYTQLNNWAGLHVGTWMLQE